jgi:hypothetical protein
MENVLYLWNNYALHEIAQDSQLNTVETLDSPFESNQMESIPKRTSPAGIKARKKRNRPHHKDPEIDSEIRQHGIDAVNIIYDSSGL